MAVVKLSKSGKQVQIIGDDGVMYMTSRDYLQRLLDCQFKIVLLSKAPLRVSKDRFKQSSIYDPNGLMEKYSDDPNILSKSDALSPKMIKAMSLP